MKIKKYIAETMPEAMKKIRHELGSDAVILNSKEITQGGFLGLFKKRKIEVVAALDTQPLTSQPDHEKQPLPIVKQQEPLYQEPLYSDQVLQELKDLKKMMALQSPKADYGPEFQVVYQHLIDQEVHSQLAKDIMDKVVKQYENQPSSTIESIYRDTKSEIKRRLTALKGEEKGHQVIHFVGPTGVGKTTTLAKIAAHSILKEGKKVAFITTDTYRIAAIEQLKTYARILDVPIEVAYSIQDYKKIVNQFKSYDLILVDTAGRNYRDKKYVKELFCQVDKEITTYIVLSLTAKPKDISDIYHQFSHIPNKELIFTKMDETRQYGSILNVALENNISIAYMTNGQNVPEDIIVPTPEMMSDQVIDRTFSDDI